MAKQEIELVVNGDHYFVAVDPHRTLVEVLREDLNLTGTKVGCGEGDCGACTVLLGDRSISSCLTLAVECHQKEITTIEGMASSHDKLHPIQQAFLEKGAVQCGFCTSGMIMSTKNLLNQVADPSEEQIRHGLSGNLCRCTGYTKIVDAVQLASDRMVSQKED